MALTRLNSLIEDHLVATVAERIGSDPGAIDVRVPFTEYGIASIEGIALISKLGEWLGQSLAPTLFWDYPTIESLAAHLAARVDLGAAGCLESTSAAEPIAIVGMACRLPGASNIREFWELLCCGADPIREIPADRWDVDHYYNPDPAAPGKMVSRWGGFLQGLDYFDAAFFRISPREAHQLDPRQRLMMELAWEALEDSGIPPLALAGSRTGVFAATLSSNYGSLIFNRHLPIVDAYSGMGNGNSVVANRLSYWLDLRGPSFSVDTACSGSLVAVHLACRSLQSGECRLALAGSANVILKPDDSIFFSKTGGLSPTGRCRPFDRRADGIVRSEGAALVVLKPLSRALSDRDHIYAVIRGSAVNQDGLSNGLMAPNGEAQAVLLREAYRRAAVPPSEVGYIEAHGTGTPLGDPIEVTALGQVLGTGRPPERKCAIGSVKANIGHLEPAAGLAGLVKAALCIEHQAIPGTPHFEEPNPLIPFDELPLAVQKTLGSWPANGATRIAGVSAFGFSGTNAHVVLSESPSGSIDPGEADDSNIYCLPLSARDPHALTGLARSYSELLKGPEAPPLRDVCYTASVRRSHLEHRLAVRGRSAGEMSELLRAFAEGQSRTGVSSGNVWPGKPPRFLFLFSGQGSAWPRMGLDLLSHDVFRRTLEACDRLVRDDASWSLLDALRAGESRLGDTEIAQPAIFALQVALAALWRSWGIAPSAVAGQSVGEVAAAHVAGALTLADSMRVVLRRSQLMNRVAGQGRTAAVGLGFREAEAVVRAYPGRLSVAGTLGPSSSVVSGSPDAVANMAEQLGERGVFCRVLPNIDIAFHSAQMDPLRRELEDSLLEIRPQAAATLIYSSVTGEPIDGEELGAHYWSRNLREPFRIAEMLARVIEDGGQHCLEVSPHPVLASSVAQARASSGRCFVAFSSLRRATPGLETMLASAGDLFTAGHTLEWASMPNGRGRHVSLPSYPWQRQRYWYDELLAGGAGERKAQLQLWGRHELLSRHVQLAFPEGTHVWERSLSTSDPAYLADHRVAGSIVLPAAAYLEMALAAASELVPDRVFGLHNICFENALYIREGARRTVQLVLSPEAPGSYSFRVFSRAEHDSVNTLHARGSVVTSSVVTVDAGTEPCEPLASIQKRLNEDVAVPDYYDALRLMGLDYGPAFRGIRSLHRTDGEALGRLELHPSLSFFPASYRLHPALLDSALQVAAAAAPRDRPREMRLPVGVKSFTAMPGNAEAVWSHAVLVADGETLEVDIRLINAAGDIVADLEGVQLRAIEQAGSRTDEAALADCFCRVEWRPHPRDAANIPAGALPSPAELLEALKPATSTWYRENDLERYDAGALLVEQFASAYIVNTLADLGLASHSRFAACEFAGFAKIAARHHRLLARLLDCAAEDGVLERTGGEFVLAAPPVPQDAEAIRRRIEDSFPALKPVLALVERCGTNLAGALTGAGDPLDLLFPGGDTTEAVAVYTATPHLQTANALAAAAIDYAVARLPEDRTVRILEIGAGTGSTTAEVLPMLAADRVEYFFTDIGPFFLAAAQKKFEKYPFVRFALLDIEQDPAPQGFVPHQFDIVVAAHVLHATADLSNSLSNVRGLLRPGGVLLLLEMPPPARCLDVTFGLTEGWWKFRDHQIRPSHPLAGVDIWQQLLHETGFPEADVLKLGNESLTPCLLIARAAAGAQSAHESSRWLILTDTGGIGSALQQQLRARGTECVAVRRCGKEGLLQVLTQMVEEGRPVEFAVHLWSLDAQAGEKVTVAALQEAQELGPLSIVDLAQAIHESGLTVKPKIWLVTCGAQPVGSDELLSPGQATLWGLGRVLAQEHPELWGGLIDLQPRAGDDAVGHLLEEICNPDGEDQVAFRGETRYVPRLASVPAPDQVSAPARLRSNASYLVTGGLSGIGLEVARWMVERGARHLVLLGRTPLPPRSRWRAIDAADPAHRRVAAICELEELGACIHAAAVDVGSEYDMARFFEAYDRAGYPPIRGLVHSAGLIEDTLILRMTQENFHAISRAKIFGAWLLHQHLKSVPLDFFVLFSSATSLVGWVGQGNYAAGNAFLDALSHYRHSLGMPAMTINWGLWGDVGMIARERRSGELRDKGMIPIPARAGLEIFERLLAVQPAQIGVMPTDTRTLGVPPNWRQGYLNWYTRTRVAADSGAPPDGELFRKILLMAPEEKQSCIESCVLSAAAHVLHVDTASLSLQENVTSLGMDSIIAVELMNRIARQLSVQISIVNLLKGSTLAEIAAQIGTEISAQSVPVADLVSRVERLSLQDTRAMLTAASEASGE
jgi:acyl transferase domain-containing protein/acyl carrier protein